MAKRTKKGKKKRRGRRQSTNDAALRLFDLCLTAVVRDAGTSPQQRPDIRDAFTEDTMGKVQQAVSVKMLPLMPGAQIIEMPAAVYMAGLRMLEDRFMAVDPAFAEDPQLMQDTLVEQMRQVDFNDYQVPAQSVFIAFDQGGAKIEVPGAAASAHEYLPTLTKKPAHDAMMRVVALFIHKAEGYLGIFYDIDGTIHHAPIYANDWIQLHGYGPWVTGSLLNEIKTRELSIVRVGKRSYHRVLFPELSDQAPKRKTPEDMTVEQYFTILAYAAKASNAQKQNIVGRMTPGGDTYEDFKSFWALLRSAKVYAMTKEHYGEVYHQADVYTDEQVAGLKWTPPKFDALGRPMPDPDNMPADDHFDLISKAGHQVEPPEDWPFPEFWVGFEDGLELTHVAIISRLERANTWKSVVRAKLHGLLFATFPDGMAISEVITVWDAAGDAGFMVSRCWTDGAWTSPYDLNPWITNAIVGVINSFRTFVVETRPTATNRYDAKMVGKREGVALPVPRPYYRIKLATRLIREKGADLLPKKTRQWHIDHRYDVSGHERCWVRRGPLPIDPKAKTRRLKKGWRYYEHGMQLSGADADRLRERHMEPPREGEWLIILSRRFDATIGGPPGKPYVPAVRRMPS